MVDAHTACFILILGQNSGSMLVSRLISEKSVENQKVSCYKCLRQVNFSEQAVCEKSYINRTQQKMQQDQPVSSSQLNTSNEDESDFDKEGIVA